MLSNTSDIINGQLVPISVKEAWRPVAWGPVPGQASGPAPVPTVPPVYSSQSFGPQSAVSGASGTDVANIHAAAAATQQPFNAKVSPVPVAIAFLLIGLIGLRLIHWR